MKHDVEQLMKDYKNLIWYLINDFTRHNKIPASHRDDIFQEVWLRLVIKLPTYDKNLSAIKTFISSTTNIVCMRYRRDYFSHMKWDELKKDDDLEAFSEEQIIHNLIESYPSLKINKDIITYKMQGYTQQEVADKVGLSQPTVSRVLSEFRDYLAEELKSG